MANTRATLSKSAIDRTVATEVDTARRAIERAINACRKAEKDPKQPKGRVLRTARELARARNGLNNISRVTPGWDPNDPDMMSEATRADLWRQRRAEEAERLRLEKEAEDATLEKEAEDAALEAEMAAEEGD